MVKQNVKTAWLNDEDGTKFAPKTLVESIQDAKGISLNDRLTELEAKISSLTRASESEDRF